MPEASVDRDRPAFQRDGAVASGCSSRDDFSVNVQRVRKDGHRPEMEGGGEE